MSASGISPAWQRDYLIRHRICPCDPTRGDSCRHCDGAATNGSEHAEHAAIAAAVAAVTARAQRSEPERKPA